MHRIVQKIQKMTNKGYVRIYQLEGMHHLQPGTNTVLNIDYKPDGENVKLHKNVTVYCTLAGLAYAVEIVNQTSWYQHMYSNKSTI